MRREKKIATRITLQRTFSGSLHSFLILNVHACSLDNLIMRFEEPSSMVRWDSPLVTIPWTDEDIPREDIWKAVMEGIVKPPNVATLAVHSPIAFSILE